MGKPAPDTRVLLLALVLLLVGAGTFVAGFHAGAFVMLLGLSIAVLPMIAPW